MHFANIPYHLIIPLVLAIASLLIILIKQGRLRKENKIAWISLLVFLTSYILILSYYSYEELFTTVQWQDFDLDKDGVLRGEESKDALYRPALDKADRDIAHFSGLIYASIPAVVIYSIGRNFFPTKVN